MAHRTAKDMSVVRKTIPFAVAIKKGTQKADIKNYLGNGNMVTLKWNLNKEATRDRIFSITINDQEAFVDLEELLSYTRLV